MDETPKGLIGELRTTILRKRVGQIALAVVLAEAVWRFISAFTWYLFIPAIGKFFRGQTESVLFPSASVSPVRWDMLFGSALEFVLIVVVVIYLNRWIHRKPSRPDEEMASDADTFEAPSLK